MVIKDLKDVCEDMNKGIMSSSEDLVGLVFVLDMWAKCNMN